MDRCKQMDHMTTFARHYCLTRHSGKHHVAHQSAGLEGTPVGLQHVLKLLGLATAGLESLDHIDST